MFTDIEIISACIFVAVTAAVFGIARLADRRGRLIAGRIDQLTELPATVSPLVKATRREATKAADPSKSKGWLLDCLLPARQGDRALLRRRLREAGIYAPSALAAYYAAKVACMIMPPLVGLAFGEAGWGVLPDQGLLMGAIAGCAGMLVPSAWLDRRVRRRHTVLRRSLPDFLDLMLVCLRGGLSAQRALQRVSDEMLIAHPVLAGELNVVQRDMELGSTLDVAIRRLAERTGEESIRTLATFIRESQRFGTQLGDSLRTLAEMLRMQRELDGEAMAQRATVKILLPTLLLIFPAVFVVLAGPAVIQIQEAFAK